MFGNYEDYLAKKAADSERDKQAVEAPAPSGPSEPSRAQPERSRKRVNPYKLQALAGKIEELESTIQTHETRVAVLAQMLASEELYRDYSLFRTTMEEHDRLQAELAGFMQKWEKLQSELAAMQPATDS